MMLCCAILVLALLFLLPGSAHAWGGPEHVAITGAALRALPPVVLSWLGAEAVRWSQVYCQYPDFNWARYGEVVCGAEAFGPEAVRFPDLRRDWDASAYCEFNEATGHGVWYAHGPRLGVEGSPISDERLLITVTAGRFAEAAAAHFFGRAVEALREGRLRDGVRFAGVMSHFLEDCSPPPHAMVMEYLNPYHGRMEQIPNKSGIDIEGYAPRILGSNIGEARAAVYRTARDLSVSSNQQAQDIFRHLAERDDDAAAQELILQCAKETAQRVNDVAGTVYSLLGDSLPQLPDPPTGVNLLPNPSFDEDIHGQNHPDKWVREWSDLSISRASHSVERHTPRCVGRAAKLFETPDAGCCWRTPWAHAIPTREDQHFELTGWVSPETASGRNYLAILFGDAHARILKKVETESVTGSHTWNELKVAAAAPPGTVDVLAGCFSESNRVAVLFDDLSLVRTRD
ncbi:MAG: hypothetical protein COZ56_12640 [Armatimonadetes bacterium CG_4_8_14_3_um_filter_58_9]|nr:MAG: hypothetical protein COZ56_12640 [Armatimonadetes bacterium CG_4_8_14_3_um_filter_58_9]